MDTRAQVTSAESSAVQRARLEKLDPPVQVRLRKKTLRSILLRAISGSKGTVGLEEIKKDEVLKNFGQRDVSGVVRPLFEDCKTFLHRNLGIDLVPAWENNLLADNLTNKSKVLEEVVWKKDKYIARTRITDPDLLPILNGTAPAPWMENSGMQMDTIKDNQAKLGLLTACLAIILVSGEKKIHRDKLIEAIEGIDPQISDTFPDWTNNVFKDFFTFKYLKQYGEDDEDGRKHMYVTIGARSRAEIGVGDIAGFVVKAFGITMPISKAKKWLGEELVVLGEDPATKRRRVPRITDTDIFSDAKPGSKAAK